MISLFQLDSKTNGYYSVHPKLRVNDAISEHDQPPRKQENEGRVELLKFEQRIHTARR